VELRALTGAILTGGHASRFNGRDKGGLVVGGRTIRERQRDALAAVCEEILEIDRAADLVPGCGPLGGVHAALARAAHDTVLVLACDMPFVSAALLQHLVALAGEADAIVPRSERGYHPLCAVYSRACLGPFARRLAAGRFTMIDVLADVRLRTVETGELAVFGPADHLLANVNTPAEHRSLDTHHVHEL
jgi:molybdopterin-guanine dinucleotide biosynthesis protein A